MKAFQEGQLRAHKTALCTLAFALVCVTLSEAIAVENESKSLVSETKNSDKSVPKINGFDAPKQAQAVEVVTLATPVASGTQASDRLQILNTERKLILQRLEKSETEIEEARNRADLAAIDREIAMAGKLPATTQRPATSQKNMPKQISSAGTSMHAANAAATSSPVSVDFESWDIFKNFGSKVHK